MFLLGLANSPDCLSCRSAEDVEHALWNCPFYTDVREKFVRVARCARHFCASVENALFPRGSRRSARVVFSALLNYLSWTGLEWRSWIFLYPSSLYILYTDPLIFFPHGRVMCLFQGRHCLRSPFFSYFIFKQQLAGGRVPSFRRRCRPHRAFRCLPSSSSPTSFP